jgi:ABC-2 type transport system ATP-binding protein
MTTQTVTNIPPAAHTGNDVLLRTVNLTKKFGELTAVNNMNLELRRGEVFGFLGPNGAGKSTTVGMILGLIAPTSGTIELFGTKLDGNSWPLIRRVGAIIEEPAFYPYMTGRDNLEALSRSIGAVPPGKIDEVLKRVNLFDRAGDQYGHYSMGMKQRLGIASTLLRDPELIILDEPTSGLDPAGTKEVRDLIPELAHEGRAVFLCSHLLHEVEMVCDHVAIIKKGTMLVSSSVQDLVSQGQRLHLRMENPAQALAVLKNQTWIKSVTIATDEYGREFLAVDAPKDSAAKINQVLAENKIFASELVNMSLSLEDVFLQLTGGHAGD